MRTQLAGTIITHTKKLLAVNSKLFQNLLDGKPGFL
jgi:hypothetical protein